MILPGFPVMTSRRPPIRFVTYSTSTGATITIPSAARAGDLCIIADFAAGGGVPASVTPSGFSAIGTELTAAFGNVKNIVSRKTLDGSEPGNAVTGMDGASSDSKIAMIFRPRQGTWSAPTETGSQSAAGTISNQTIGSATAPYIALGIWGGNVLPARGFSVTHDGEVTFGSIAIRWKAFNDSPAAVTLTCDSGSGGWRILRSIRVPLTL